MLYCFEWGAQGNRSLQCWLAYNIKKYPTVSPSKDTLCFVWRLWAKGLQGGKGPGVPARKAGDRAENTAADGPGPAAWSGCGVVTACWPCFFQCFVN